MKLLDTCFLIDLLRGDPGAVVAAQEVNGAATTAVNIYELFFGVYNATSNVSQRIREAERLVERLKVLELDEESSKMAAENMVELYREGLPLDALDVFTASIGLTNNYTQILTRNTSHYKRIQGIEAVPY
ncbi:MAG: type II toxin-antitoxin system VapC family toxin [Candidatus Bathyarchaeia archaeon]